MCLIGCYILRLKKLHVSAGSGHHQFLSFDSLKIILYNSRGGVFDEETSTSKTLLGHSTSILGVCVCMCVCMYVRMYFFYYDLLSMLHYPR